MSFLDALTPEQITRGPLPLKDLLHNSLYYPSSGFDGGVIKDCNTLARDLNIVSFIYCEYATAKEIARIHQDEFLGYHILGTRSLRARDLTPNGWHPQPPPGTDRNSRYPNSWEPFATWTVYERDAQRDETHGPERFSLIFIGGDEMPTYQAIYWSNRATPKVLAIIQPSIGLKPKWMDLRKKDGILPWLVGQNPYGQPDTIYYGGIDIDHNAFDWEDFVKIRCIKPYFKNNQGEVNVWQKR